MQTDFEAIGGTYFLYGIIFVRLRRFQIMCLFPLKNRCIVFFMGKNSPTETKNAFFGKCLCLPKKAKRRDLR